ncbi:hypothetical protein D0T50_13240 [Bacteroides sp. 214]|uniref:hypothetical protein n=1 Tax=Bacteroides sp. 214 TaxID=2302935 RepID=UPI0013D49DE3|nr:hypothetical protein [Bacteroides sp. 214]NDW13846.1 hypothetical protein [Bacteroides sp. 214]
MVNSIKLLFLVLLIFSSSIVVGQNAKNHFLFDDFEAAKVVYKNKNTSNGRLNYNAVTREMVFVGEDGKNKALYPVDTIDTIYIAGRTFVPYEKEFYELLPAKSHVLYAVHRCEIQLAGQSTGYGTSSTSAIHDVSSISAGDGIYQLKLPDNYKTNPSVFYLILLDGKLTKIKKAKDLVKLFPAKKNEINRFLKNANIKGDKERIIAVLDFLGEND